MVSEYGNFLLCFFSRNKKASYLDIFYAMKGVAFTSEEHCKRKILIRAVVAISN